MKAAELVISLLLDTRGVQAGAAQAQAALDQVAQAATAAEADMAAATGNGATGLHGVAGATEKLQAAFTKAVEEGKELAEVSIEAQKMRAALEAAGASSQELAALDRAAKKLGVSLSQAAEEGADGFDRLRAGAQRTLAVIGGVAFLKATTMQYLSVADAAGKFADAMGENVEDVQAWGEAAARAGGSAEGFYASLDALNEKVQDWHKFGSGEAKEVFTKLGISATSDGKIKTSTMLLGDLAARFEGLGKAEAFGLGKKLGLDPGTIMLLQSGRTAVDDLIKRQKELGVYTKQDAEIAAKANDAIADMGQAFRGVAAVFMRIAGPAITWVADKLTTMTVWMRKNEPFVLAFFTGIGAVILTALVPALGTMAAAAWAAIAPFTPFIAIVAGLALVIDDLIAYINGGESALSGFWSMFGTGEEIANRLSIAWEQYKTYLLGIWDVLGGVVKLFGSLFALDGSGIGRALEQMMQGLHMMQRVLGNLLDYVTSKLANLLPGWVKDLIGLDGEKNGGEKNGEGKGNAPAAGVPVPPVPVGAPVAALSRAASAPAVAGSVNNSRTVSQQTSIGEINVYPQSADGPGVARDMAAALPNTFANQADGALR